MSSTRELGSGTFASDPVYDPLNDSVVALVEVIVPETETSPVAPAK